MNIEQRLPHSLAMPKHTLFPNRTSFISVDLPTESMIVGIATGARSMMPSAIALHAARLVPGKENRQC